MNEPTFAHDSFLSHSAKGKAVGSKHRYAMAWSPVALTLRQVSVTPDR